MLGKIALIVDDSPTARTVLKHKLNQFDVVVESACDGSNALELLRDHVPDIIFLDHIMPGLDGFQVLRRLKDNHNTSGIPVVMYTSQAAPHYTSEAKLLGAIGVIPKQVTNDALIQMLDKAELYRLEAVNADHHTAAAAPRRNDQTRRSPASEAVATTAAPANSEPSPVEQQPTNTAATGKAEPAHRSRQNTGQRGGLSITHWLLILLVLAQGVWVFRDYQQREQMTQLRSLIEAQNQQLLLTRSELMAEQRRSNELNWKQLQFAVDTLVSQLSSE